MNLSRPFIQRPIATVLLTIGIALVGIAAFFVLPVSPLPQVDYPSISVSASMAVLGWSMVPRFMDDPFPSRADEGGFMAMASGLGALCGRGFGCFQGGQDFGPAIAENPAAPDARQPPAPQRGPRNPQPFAQLARGQQRFRGRVGKARFQDFQGARAAVIVCREYGFQDRIGGIHLASFLPQPARTLRADTAALVGGKISESGGGHNARKCHGVLFSGLYSPWCFRGSTRPAACGPRYGVIRHGKEWKQLMK